MTKRKVVPAKMRIAILAQNEQSAKYARSCLRFRPESVEVFEVYSMSDLLKIEKVNLLIEAHRFYSHPKAEEIEEVGIKLLV
jgi:hypothetical protein